jgi:SM-20-related protein
MKQLENLEAAIPTPKAMGSLADEIQIYDDIIPTDIQKKLAATVKQQVWGYDWRTAISDVYPVWGRSVTNPLRGARNAEEHLLQNQQQDAAGKVWNQFQDSFLRGHSLMRAFVIGFHHGCEGYAHIDNVDPEDHGAVGRGLNLTNYRSTIIFAFDEWEASWGGEMLIFDREGKELIMAVTPKPFRVLSFPGLLPHKPNGPTRDSDKFLPLLSFRSKQILRM